MAGHAPQRQTAVAADPGELSRRLGNSYAMLRSIIRRSAESATSVESFAWHLEGRLDVIGRIMLAVMREPGGSLDRWLLSGPPVTMNAAAAEALGLLFYEPVTNSIEHGILGSEDGGELQVSWRVEPGGDSELLHLDWIERGAPATLDRHGFGTMVLEEMLRYQLDAEAEREFGPEGVRVSVAVPMRSLVQGNAGPAVA